jgi:hypothetical protein
MCALKYRVGGRRAVPSRESYRGNIKESAMILGKTRKLLAGVAAATVILAVGLAYAQQEPRGKSSYMPVDVNRRGVPTPIGELSY